MANLYKFHKIYFKVYRFIIGVLMVLIVEGVRLGVDATLVPGDSGVDAFDSLE